MQLVPPPTTYSTAAAKINTHNKTLSKELTVYLSVPSS